MPSCNCGVSTHDDQNHSRPHQHQPSCPGKTYNNHSDNNNGSKGNGDLYVPIRHSYGFSYDRYQKRPKIQTIHNATSDIMLNDKVLKEVISSQKDVEASMGRGQSSKSREDDASFSGLKFVLIALTIFLASIAFFLYLINTPLQVFVEQLKNLNFEDSTYDPHQNYVNGQYYANKGDDASAGLPRVLAVTHYGKIEGYRRTLSPMLNNKEVNVFLGVPYAEPPTGQLRFRKPQPINAWNGVRRATRYAPQCIQVKPNKTFTPWISRNGEMSEDCLYLNIWTPEMPPHIDNRVMRKRRGATQHKNLRPVMVWIHGGAFFSGSSDVMYYDGAALSTYGDVVVVTINYRLASFGFLDSKTDDAPGNQGLHDQVLALKWIRENIAVFGGDPNSVTLFGQSAGAISIGLHYLSPLSQALFTRGILQSGSPTVTRMFYEREELMNERGNLYAQKLGCTLNGTWTLFSHPQQVINCIRLKPAEELAKVQAELINEVSLSFGPTAGDDFLPDHPIQLMHEGRLGPNNKEAMIGVNKDEGSFFAHFFDPKIFHLHESARNLSYSKGLEFVMHSLNFLPRRIAQLTTDMFLSWAKEEKDPVVIRNAITDFLGDSTFNCPAVIFAQLLSQEERDVYFYQFDHRPAGSPWGEWMGTVHFDEVPFVFGYPLVNQTGYTEDEIEMSRQMMKNWANFARYGSPASPPAKGISEWPLYTSDHPQYMSIKGNEWSVNYGPKESTCNKWRIMLENS